MYGVFDISKNDVVFTSLHNSAVERFVNELAEEKKQHLVCFDCSDEKLVMIFRGIFPDEKYFEELQNKLLERGILKYDEEHHLCPVMRENNIKIMHLQNKRVKAKCNNNKCELKGNCLILKFNP